MADIPTSPLPNWMINHPRAVCRHYQNFNDVTPSDTSAELAGTATIDDGVTAGNLRMPQFFLNTVAANDFCEVVEGFSQDIFGYFGGTEFFDSMWGYPNYFSTIFRHNVSTTPTGSFGLCFGKIFRAPPATNLNDVSCGIYWDWATTSWKVFVNNKWNAVAGNRYFEINLGRIPYIGCQDVAFETIQKSFRLELFVKLPEYIIFAMNGRIVHKMEDRNFFPHKPLQEIYDNRATPGSTKAGMVIFLKQLGAGAMSIYFADTKAQTIPREVV